VKNHYPVPIIEGLLDELSRALGQVGFHD